MQAFAQKGLVLSLRAGGRSYSLAAQDAGEILRNPKVTRVPNAPAALDGITSLRGAIVPVFSLARLLDADEAAPGGTSLVLVLAGGAVGLSIDDVTTLREDAETSEIVRPLDIERLARGLFQTRATMARTSSGAQTPVRKSAMEAREVGLLGFDLAGQDYALPLAHVDEVLAAPADATRLPEGRAGDLGVAHLRGALLPLISLRVLLGLDAHTSAEDLRHVVVVRLGSARIGFVVDRLTSVRRARADALSAVPSILNRGGGEARITSIYRDDDGRLVSILSPERLFADPSLLEQLDGLTQESSSMQGETASGGSEQIVVFRLGSEEFALPIVAVDEIARLPDAVTRVPRAPAFVKGVMNLRGRVIPLIDQSDRFGVDRSESFAAGRKRVVIAHFDDLVAGFIVDEVREILTVPSSQIRVAPSVGSEDPQTFDRVAMLDVEGRMILMIDPRELLSRAERDLIAHEAWVDQPSADT